MVKELRLALRPFLISFFAPPAKSTAAIVVSRRCFISLQLLILHRLAAVLAEEGDAII